MSSVEEIAKALASIFSGISHLKSTFPERQFTIDGRLVGDIGEVIAAIVYEIELDEVSQPNYDATSIDGRRVQIKATFQDALTFKTVPDYYIGLKLYRDGRYEEIYNGPGTLIYEKYKHRAGIGEKLLRFPNQDLNQLSFSIPNEKKIPRRDG